MRGKEDSIPGYANAKTVLTTIPETRALTSIIIRCVMATLWLYVGDSTVNVGG